MSSEGGKNDETPAGGSGSDTPGENSESGKKVQFDGGNNQSSPEGGSTSDSVKPSPFGGGFSMSGNKQSPFGGGTSTFGNKQSPFGSGTPTFGSGTKLSPFGGGTSGFGSKQSPFGGGTTTFGSGQSSFGSGASDSGNKQSPFGGGKTGFGSSPSPFGSGASDSGNKQSPFGGGKTGFGSSPSPFGGGTSGFGSKQSPFGGGVSGQASGAGAKPSPFGSSQSSSGGGTPVFGNKTSPFGSSPSPFGGGSSGQGAGAGAKPSPFGGWTAPGSNQTSSDGGTPAQSKKGENDDSLDKGDGASTTKDNKSDPKSSEVVSPPIKSDDVSQVREDKSDSKVDDSPAKSDNTSSVKDDKSDSKAVDSPAESDNISSVKDDKSESKVIDSPAKSVNVSMTKENKSGLDMQEGATQLSGIEGLTDSLLDSSGTRDVNDCTLSSENKEDMPAYRYYQENKSKLEKELGTDDEEKLFSKSVSDFSKLSSAEKKKYIKTPVNLRNINKDQMERICESVESQRSEWNYKTAKNKKSDKSPVKYNLSDIRSQSGSDLKQGQLKDKNTKLSEESDSCLRFEFSQSKEDINKKCSKDMDSVFTEGPEVCDASGDNDDSLQGEENGDSKIFKFKTRYMDVWNVYESVFERYCEIFGDDLDNSQSSPYFFRWTQFVSGVRYFVNLRVYDSPHYIYPVFCNIQSCFQNMERYLFDIYMGRTAELINLRLSSISVQDGKYLETVKVYLSDYQKENEDILENLYFIRTNLHKLMNQFCLIQRRFMFPTH